LALDSREVQSALKERQPDVAVISASLKDGPNTGLKVARQLWTSASKTKVIILIEAGVGPIVVEALRAGVHGLICRDDPFETLCQCIYAVQQGQVWINSKQMLYLVDYLVRTAPTSPVHVASSNVLSKREAGVAQLVAEGLTNREISRELHLSENTVRNYLFRIFNKLGTSTRLELALYEHNRRQVHGISESLRRSVASIAESGSAGSVRLT
jgi:DNA-binding NarL/FixJ family response regulator